MNLKSSRIFITILIIFLSFPTFANAKVGEDLFDSAKLQSSIPYQPYADSNYTSVYTPWFKMFHVATDLQKQEGIVAGEACQQIKTIRVSPFDENIVLAGTDTNGIWKSNDGGNYWYNTGGSDFEFMYIADIFFDKKNQNCVYMISSEAMSNSSLTTNAGVYKSEDNGKSWKHVLNIFVSSLFTDKLIASDANGGIYVAGDDGVYNTIDGGESWKKISTFELNGEKVQSISVSSDASTILVSYSGNTEKSGLYISKDGGATWNKTDAIYVSQDTSAYATEIHPADNNTIIASFEYIDKDTQISKYSLLRSNDCGLTWIEISDENWSKYCVTKLEYAKNPKKDTYRLFINRNKNNTPLCYTDDNGENYSFPSYSIACSLQPNYMGYFSQGFDVSDNNSDIVYAAKGGVVKSLDAGENFSWSNSGFSGLNVAYVNQSETGRLCFSCHDVGIVTSNGIYDGANFPAFKITGNFSLEQTAYDPKDERRVFASVLSDDEGYYIGISNDYGNTFEKLFAVDKAQSFIMFDINDKNVIYTNEYTSYDNGKSWTKNDFNYAAISADGKIRYKTVGDGQAREVYISLDSGKTWNFIAAPGYTSRLGNEVIIDVENPLKCYYLSSHNFFAIEYVEGSNSIMKKFTLGKEPLKYNGIFSFAQNPKDAKHIIIGTMQITGKKAPGLMETYDGGENWHSVRGLPGSRGVYNVTFSKTTDEVFVCNCNGVILYDYNEYKKYIKEIPFISNYKDTLGSSSVIKGYEGDIITLPENDFSRNGYEFLHWSDLKNAYNPKDEYMISSDIEKFYAVWKYTGNYDYGFSVDNASYYSKTGDTISILDNGYDCLLKNDSMLLYKIDATNTGDAAIKKATLKIYADRAYAGDVTFYVYNLNGDFSNYTINENPVSSLVCKLDGVSGINKITNGSYSLISIDITQAFKNSKCAFIALKSTGYTNGGTKIAGINHIGKKPYVEISTTNDCLFFTSKDETGSEFFVNSFSNIQNGIKLNASISSEISQEFSRATPIIAMYSNENKLEEVIVGDEIDIDEGYLEIFSDSTIFDSYKNSKIKVFLFNNIFDITPVVNNGLLE